MGEIRTDAQKPRLEHHLSWSRLDLVQIEGLDDKRIQNSSSLVSQSSTLLQSLWIGSWKLFDLVIRNRLLLPYIHHSYEKERHTYITSRMSLFPFLDIGKQRIAFTKSNVKSFKPSPFLMVTGLEYAKLREISFESESSRMVKSRLPSVS